MVHSFCEKDPVRLDNDTGFQLWCLDYLRKEKAER